MVTDRRENSSSTKLKGMMGTTLIHALLFGFLITAGFSTATQTPETGEGILVNFGTGDTGLGDIEPSPPSLNSEVTAPVPKERSSPVTSSSSRKASGSKEESYMTQDKEESPAVKKDNPDVVRKKKVLSEEDKKLREEQAAEKLRIKQEEAERKKAEEAQQRESDIMNRTKNALADSKNRGTSSTGEGIAGGPGNQGDPNGSIYSKVRGVGSGLGTSGTGTGANGIAYQLAGRGFQSLPKPEYDYQKEGRVVVEISVDRNGKVVQANPGIKGSTTLDESLLRTAKEAALKARFEVKQDAPPIQKGTIVYNFVLK